LLIIIWYIFIIIFGLGLGLNLQKLASASASRFWPRLTSLPTCSSSDHSTVCGVAGRRSALMSCMTCFRGISIFLSRFRTRSSAECGIVNAALPVRLPVCCPPYYANGCAIGTVLRPSVVICTECIVAKRCVLEEKLLLTAYRKSYMTNRLVPK